jgi:two-component system sensor histidine kinase VicK
MKLPKKEDKKLQSIRHAESEALFTSIGDGAISTDENGVITRINTEGKKILRIEDDIIGKKLSETIITYDNDNKKIPEKDKLSKQVLDTKKTISVRRKVSRHRKDDRMIDIFANIAPIIHKDRAIGTIIIFRDVSEEIKLENMKNDFISLASHQLRTPLSSISTYSHMLVDGMLGDLDDEQIKIVKTIVKSANRMNGVISSLMNISKIDNKAVTFSPKNTDINNLLDGAYHENRVGLEEKNIKYTILNDSNKPCIVYNDPILITEIINNVISNAIKYTEDGGSIAAKAIRTEIGVTIEITDTGIGINIKDKDKIFEKFFRAPGVTKYDTFGSGLGLYIVKGFLDIIGGSVSFKSAPNIGTTFSITIPDLQPSTTSL